MSETVPEPVGASEAASTVPFAPELIIAELDEAFDHVPEAAIREARAHRDEMVPRLIQVIRDAAAKVRAGDKVEGNAHFFALLILTEFNAREALPAIIEAVFLPGEGPLDLFNDAITSLLAGILVRLSDDPLTLIDGLIQNAALNEYVRWEAAQAYVHLVRAGRLRREEAVEHLRRHLLRELDTKFQSMVVTGLVCTLNDLAPKEAYEEIKEAFKRNLVEEFMIGMKSIDGSIAEGEAGVQRNLDNLHTFDDAIEELGKWASFQPQPKDESESTPIPWPTPDSKPRAAELDFTPPVKMPMVKPFVGKRPGRNEPCPCGSGKKYKKCCLDKDQNR